MNGSPCASGLHYRGRCWTWESVRPLCPCPRQMTRKHCPRKPASPPPASVFPTCPPSCLFSGLNVVSVQKQMSFCKQTKRLNFLSFSFVRLSSHPALLLLCMPRVHILNKDTKYLYESVQVGNKNKCVVYSIYEVNKPCWVYLQGSDNQEASSTLESASPSNKHVLSPSALKGKKP